MSRDPRKSYYRGPDHDRNRPIWGRSEYRSNPNSRRDLIKGSRSRSPPMRSSGDKSRRSRSPRKNDKDLLDENILSEISKLPEPSELWESNQYQDPNFAAAAASVSGFPAEGSAPLGYQANYQPQYSGIYDDFPPLASAPQSTIPPPDMATWNQMSLPPPPAQFINLEDQMKKEAAIETEMRHQKAALSKQREDYMKKATILKKELDTLKDQRNELRGDSKRSPSPDTKRFLKENTKLQLEIQNKLKTINNVVDMLNGIIGEEAPELPDSDDSDHGSKRKSRSPSNKKFNYVYYDPEMHWCRVCNEFPPTAKDYLNHLHSLAHHKMAAAHMEAPWHSVSGINEGFPSFPSAPTKRTPIKGLQFFVPSTAWYCKLCDQFIGDLHCASAHLKSVTHSKNYTNFVELNPHWETDWMSDRQKAFEKARASNKVKPEDKPQYTAHTITFHKDGFHTKNKIDPTSPDKKKKKDKKKKSKRKRSTSSSDSDSSSTDSEPEKKRKKSKSTKDIPNEKALTEWMSTIQMDRLNESDRKLLDSLKSRMKSEKQEPKRRSPERQRSPDSRKGRESERRDISSRDRRERKSRSRDSRPRDSRPREPPREGPRGDSRGDSRRRDDRPQSLPPADSKKPEVRKMPFIGKMPVYKHLGKKVEDQKKEELEQKKKEEDEANKKRREEMDAEIQKKVAEFKEKIAIAQKERSQALELPPPGVALPTQLGAASSAYLPPTSVASAAPATLPKDFQAALPKDFQEALDIIFPTEVKQELAQAQQDLFNMTGLPPFPMPLGFPPLPLMQPQMFGFDMNAPLFQPRPQLYDTHVPLVPSPKPRQRRPQQKTNNQNSNKQNNQNSSTQNMNYAAKAQADKENGAVERKKEELDDLAMLGIDASDVGAGI